MKKEILVAISVAGVLFGLSVSLAAQEKLSLAQCREMALKYNKDMAAANKQTEAARLMSLSYKANFFWIIRSELFTRAVYKWSNLFIWEEKSVPPIKCHYWEKKWHT